MSVRIIEVKVVVDDAVDTDDPRAKIAEVIAFAAYAGPEFEDDAAFIFDLKGVEVEVTADSNPDAALEVWKRGSAPVEPTDHTAGVVQDDGNDAPSYP